MEPTALTRYSGNVDGALLALCIVAGIAPPLGVTKRGQLIWPIEGADDAALEARIEELTKAIGQLGTRREESQPEGKAADGGRYAAALDGSKATADELAELHQLRQEKAEAAAKAERRQLIEEVAKELMGRNRTQSKAASIGDGSAAGNGREPLHFRQGIKASPVQQAIFGNDYEAGSFLTALAGFKGQLSDGIDIELINQGKAALEEFGVLYLPAPAHTGKATLGATGATGGYVLPNNLVDAVVKPNTQMAVYRDLVTVIPGVAVRGIDQPYRMGAPTRMTYADWGTTKENVNEDYGSYTANLVTFARIYDIGKQYLRFSAGAAERDVLDELAKAADLAENYEVIAGPGSGSVGSGDACLGVYTSLNASPTFLGYKGAKTGSASNSTVAGSFASACAELMGLLVGRNRFPSGIVVDHTTYFTAIAQGSDSAGFWVNPAGGPTGFARNESGQLTYWGVPIFYDTNLGSNATTKIAIAAEWKAFKLYRGIEFRIDSSDVAGDRWDKNLVGFRGEMELGFNAETPVHVGAAQLMTSVIP